MSLLITSGMLYLNAAGRYAYDLTADVDGGITVSPGLGGIIINGNGHTVYGSGAAGLDLGTNNPYITVRDLQITGSFTDGVIGTNANGTFLNNVDVSNSLRYGYDLSGGSISVADATISNIGGLAFPNKAFGINITGSDAYITSSYILGIHGESESVGISFDAADGKGYTIDHVTIDGSESTGWSFGVWSSNDSVILASETYIHDFAQAVGAGGGLTLDHGTVNNVGWLGQVTGVNDSSLLTGQQSSAPTLTGDNFRNFLVGDSSAQTLVGNGGHDVLYGFGGADTFIFNDASFSTIADFEQGTDLIGLDHNAFGSSFPLAVGAYALTPGLYWNEYDHSLNYDADGLGGAAPSIIAYMPTVATLQQTDLLLV